MRAALRTAVIGRADPDLAALLARFTTQPTVARKVLIAALIKSLKAAGVWSKLDGLYLFAAADSQAARLNWIANSRNYSPNGAMTFTADQGYAGNGSTGSGTFGLSFSTLTKFQQNSASAGCWSRTAAAADTVDLGITSTDDNFRMISYNTLFAMSGRINATSTTSAAVGTGVGFAAMNRSGASAVEFYKNGVSVGTDTTSSTSRANNDLTTHNDKAASYSARQLACVFIGGSMTAAEHLALYNAVNAYLQGVGAA